MGQSRSAVVGGLVNPVKVDLTKVSECDRDLLQRCVFALGGAWRDGNVTPYPHDVDYLFLEERGLSKTIQKVVFLEVDSEEKTFEELLDLFDTALKKGESTWEFYPPKSLHELKTGERN